MRMKNAVGTVGSVLVLGGRSEIGLSIAQRLVQGGARTVVLAVRGGEVDAKTIDGLKALGAAVVEAVEFDMSKPETHREAIESVVERFGDLDVIIDAAGVLGSSAEFEKDPVAAAEAGVANFSGHLSAGLVVAEVLKRQGHGTFIVLSSVAGVRVRKANYVYGATKAGLDGFAQGLGDALAGTGARVMVVRPGFIRTQMTTGMPDGPFSIGPDEVATAVVDGLRLGKEMVYAPARLGPVFAVLRLLPRPIWRRMPR
jgi:decaprenylphospho-beta-D-erythro-pentofuranosid-2-ulose 2-reductase